MPNRTSVSSPLDGQLVAYRDNANPAEARTTDFQRWVEDITFVGTEIYEMLNRRHRYDDGLEDMRSRSGIETVNGMRRLRDWRATTREIVLVGVERVERLGGFNAVANTQHLRAYLDRADGLLAKWDATPACASSVWRDEDLSPAEIVRLNELAASGAAKLRVTPRPISPTA